MPFNLLDLGAIKASPYATRDLEQSLELIDAASQMRRTINGTLIDVSLSQFQKYRSLVTGKDHYPPALDGIEAGQTVTVQCAAELSYLTAGGSPSRAVTTGSSRTDGDFTFYRPELSMKVLRVSQKFDQRTHDYTWSVDLEEV
jgi:hypothetical protein